MKDQLKSYADQNVPVEAQDKIWDYARSVSRKFEAESLKELAQSIAVEGENLWEYLTLTASNIKKLG